MTAVMERVYKEALELPLDQRLTLVYHILEQSETGSNSESAEREWDGVIRERMERYDSGKAKPVRPRRFFRRWIKGWKNDRRISDRSGTGTG